MTRALAFMLVLALPAAAPAQPAPAPPVNARCTTLAVFAGISFAGGDSGPVIGAASEWGLTPRLSLEGRARWFDRGPGSEFFSATLNLVGALARVGRTEAFVKGGLGVMTATLDPDRAVPPGFYGRRIGAPGPGQRREFSFTDPAVAMGAGLAVQLGRHLSVRPEVEAITAWRGSRAFLTTGMAVHVAYHFERHIVTP
jgi:hypothetical protein